MKNYSYCTSNPMIYKMLKEFARHNRRYMTQAESILWKLLRNNALGVKFRRQHIIGEFIADFACLEHFLIIELDGNYHQLPEQQCSDEERTAWLAKQGFKVIRFTNEEVIGDTDNVLRIIKDNINK